MWKYVSRRFRDTFEFTYNVLDVRRTWTCGVSNDNYKGKNKNAPVKCNLPAEFDSKTDYSSGSSEKFKKRRTSSSSDNNKKAFNFNCDPNTSKFCPLGCVGALYWSGTLLLGFYTSQLISLKYRRRALGAEWRSEPRDSLSKEVVKRFYANTSTNYVTKPRNYQRSEIPIYINQNEIGDFYQNYYRAIPINNPKTTGVIQKSDATPSTSENTQSSNNSQPLLEDAIDNLVATLANIEFKLGLHSLAAEDNTTAVSHFKLATSHRHPGATFNLGLCYELGLGVEKNLKNAMECYRAASVMGHSKAMYNLGIFYVKGLGGLKKSHRAARACFTAAKEMGLQEAREAMNMPEDFPKKDEEICMKKNKILIDDVIDKQSIAIG